MGLNIQLDYDSDVSNAPAAFKTALSSVVQLLDAMFSNNITANIEVGWGSIGSVAGGDYQFVPADESLGGPDGGTDVTLAQLKIALAAHGTSADDATALASLGIDTSALTNSGVASGATIYLSAAQCRALGISALSSTYDGEVGFGAGSTNYDFNVNGRTNANGEWDFFGVAMHELTHALGRIDVLDLTTPELSLMDLFRYSGTDTRQLVDGSPAYFSINGGVTNIDNYATTSDTGDWGAMSGNDSFDASSDFGVPNNMSSADVRLMNVLGFNLSNFTAAAAVTAYNSPLPDDWMPIVDTAANVDSNIDALQTLASGGAISTLTISDPLNLVTLTAVQATHDTTVLALIEQGTADIDITGYTGKSYASVEDDFVNGKLTGSLQVSNPSAGLSYSLVEYDFSGGALTKSIITYNAGLPYGTIEYDYVSGALVDDLITGFPSGTTYTEIEQLFTSGAVTATVFSGYTGEPFTQIRLDFNASSGALTDQILSGYTTTGYAQIEQFYTSGALTQQIVSGFTSQPFTTITTDYASTGSLTETIYSGFTSTGYASEDLFYATNGSLASYSLNNTNSTTTTVLSEAGQTTSLQGFNTDTLYAQGFGGTLDYTSGFGADVINGFQSFAAHGAGGQDLLDLFGGGFTTTAQALAAVVDDGHGNTVITLADAGHDTLTLLGIAKSSLSTSDFKIA